MAKRTLENGGKRQIIKNIQNTVYDALSLPINAIFGRPGKGSYGGGTFSGSGTGGKWTPQDFYYNEIYAPDTLMVPTRETFNDAFARARRAGLDTFEWNGGTYSTEMSDNPNWKQAGDSRYVESLAPLIIPADTIRRRSKHPHEDVYHPSRFK